ncbi:MAG TPA: SDR family NAD(P)-dependent oxidoreductase [Solirubrobacterales bacterium]|jgi:short-subunit dehydrogenase|nr:SDR family NAD(P)-dependent oxidoreductase [Solirubrobacterales bacterium]
MESHQSRPLAVVTGASSGIGFELAKIFGENGYDLLIAAEDGELSDAQQALKASGASVEAHRVDLATEAGVIELYRQIANSGRPVEALALNAGIGAGGAFATETELADELRLIDLNVRSTVHLCKLVLADMVERDEGRILFTSSIASTMPGSFQAVYNASKSFVQSFALAIRNELKDSEVTVTSLMPGPTETEFFERAEMEDTKVGSEEKDDPAEVARQGFEALMAGREKIVGGSFKNKVQTVAGKIIPDSKKAEMHRGMAEPGSAKDD